MFKVGGTGERGDGFQCALSVGAICFCACCGPTYLFTVFCFCFFLGGVSVCVPLRCGNMVVYTRRAIGLFLPLPRALESVRKIPTRILGFNGPGLAGGFLYNLHTSPVVLRMREKIYPIPDGNPNLFSNPLCNHTPNDIFSKSYRLFLRETTKNVPGALCWYFLQYDFYSVTWVISQRYPVLTLTLYSTLNLSLEPTLVSFGYSIFRPSPRPIYFFLFPFNRNHSIRKTYFFYPSESKYIKSFFMFLRVVFSTW